MQHFFQVVDLSDVWLRFDLREDLVKGLKVGDRFGMRVPALGNRLITAAIKVIATKGEYADGPPRLFGRSFGVVPL